MTYAPKFPKTPPARKQLQEELKKLKGRNKYKAVNKDQAGNALGFPSRLEANTFQQLCLLEKAGAIRDLRRQHAVRFPCGNSWKIDFSYTDCKTGERVYLESKGAEGEGYRLKKMMYCGCPILEEDAKLEIWKADRRGEPALVEEVKPKRKPETGGE
jgi:hypothetical protein